jgi:hypothetical protein
MTAILTDRAIEDGERLFQQTLYPFRFRSNGGALLIEVPLKFVLATAVYGGIPIGVIVLFLPLLGINENVFFFLLISAWLFALSTAYSKKIVSWYDKRSHEFGYEKCLWWGRTTRFVWPLDKFSAISYGAHGFSKGRATGLRLHAHNNKYVLGFMYGDNDAESERLAQRLSELSGLTNIGYVSTGKQDVFDDLKEARM